MADSGLSPIDARLSVVASLFRPALVLARVMGLTLDEVRELAESGYVREFQDRGLSWEGMARRMGKSRRTIGTLVRRAASHRVPLSTSKRLGAQRTLVERLSRAPAAREKLLADLRSSEGGAAFAQLIEDGLVQVDESDVVSLKAGLLDLVGTDLDARLDSLRHFLDVVTTAVHQRFFPTGDREGAFVRTLTFQVSDERMKALRSRVYQTLEDEVFAADAESEGTNAPSASVSFVLTRPSSDGRLRS